MDTHSRVSRPINDCFVKKMGNPFLSGSKVPIIAHRLSQFAHDLQWTAHRSSSVGWSRTPS